MVKIEKIKFNEEETAIIEKFFEIIEELDSMEFDTMEIDIHTIHDCVQEFFFENENVSLDYGDEEFTED